MYAKVCELANHLERECIFFTIKKLMWLHSDGTGMSEKQSLLLQWKG